MNRGYPKLIPTPASINPLAFDYAQLPNQNRSGAFVSDLTPVLENGHGNDLRNQNAQPAYNHAQQPQQALRVPLSASSPSKTPVGSRRSSSSQSLQNISEPDSDESDDDGGYVGTKKGQGSRDRRREAHTQAEQKRRDAIKKGYQQLEEELPTFQDTVGSQKPSKAVVLQRSIEYVEYLEKQKKKQAEELDELQKDYMGLQIMKQAYEKMATAMRNQPDQGSAPIPDEVKFQVFQLIMDNLFQSFDRGIVTTCFAELSGSAFSWLEEWCTPQHVRSITLSVLHNLKNSNVGKKS